MIIDVLKRLPESGTIIDLEKRGGGSGTGSARGREIVQQQVLPNLEKLQQDDDVDVRYFAMTAAKTWEESSEGDVKMHMSP